MSAPEPDFEDIIAALLAGRVATTRADGTMEIGPEEPIDPEEQGRVDEFIRTLGVPPDDETN